MKQKLDNTAKLTMTQHFDKSGVSDLNAPIRYHFLIDGDVSDHMTPPFPI